MATTAHIIAVEIALQIPHAQSLKDKRRCVKGLKEKLQSRFNASVAEMGALDEWQHAELGVVMIGNDRQYLQTQVSEIEKLAQEFRDVVIVDFIITWL